MLTWVYTFVKLDLVYIVALIVCVCVWGGGGGGMCMFCEVCVLSSFAIILMGKRELDALL